MDEFVYIVTNPSIPGQIKVGRTSNLKRRLKELQSSGVPTPYHYEFVILVEDSKTAESSAHYVLRFNRVSSNREFFKIDVAEAIKKITNEIKFFEINWGYTPRNNFTNIISENLDDFALRQIRKIEREIEEKSAEIKDYKIKKDNIESRLLQLKLKKGPQISLTKRLKLRIFGDQNKILSSESANILVMSNLINEIKEIDSRIESCLRQKSDLKISMDIRSSFFKEEIDRFKSRKKQVSDKSRQNINEIKTNDYSMEQFDWYRDEEGIKCDILHECYPNGEFHDYGNEISIRYKFKTYYITTEKIEDFEYYKKQQQLF